MKNINNYISSKITKIIFLICVIFQSTINAQTLQIDNVTVNGIAISNNTINFGDLTQVTLKFRVHFEKPLVLDIGETKYVAGTYKCNTFTNFFTPETIIMGQNHPGFYDWREYTIYANDYPLSCGNGNKLRATVTKTTGNVTYYSNEILITKNPRFALSSSVDQVKCNENVTFTVINLDNISASYQWFYDQTKWQTITTGASSIVLKPISAPLSPVYVAVNANGTTYNLYRIFNFVPFSPNVQINNESLCHNSTRTYTLSGLQQGETLIEWSLSNTNFATISNINGNNITLNYISNGTFSLNAKIRNQCNQEVVKSFQLRAGKPADFPATTIINGPSIVLTGALTQYSITAPLPIGATSYEWWLPHPFDNVTTFDYFGQNWQKYSGYHGSGSGLSVFTGLSKQNGLIQVAAKNECGCSGAIMKSVSHQSSSTGGSTGSGGGRGNNSIVNGPSTGGAIPRMANNKDLLEYNNINIYPNPITEILNIELLNEFNNLSKIEEVNVEIIDLQGKKIKNITEKSNKISINVNDISKGVYILKINIKDKTETQKIVLQ